MSKEKELLSECVPYLESIKSGPGDLILLIKKIKDCLKPTSKQIYNSNGCCIRCEGTGNIATTYSHDCWGKTERDYERCPDCNGYGRSQKYRN